MYRCTLPGQKKSHHLDFTKHHWIITAVIYIKTTQDIAETTKIGLGTIQPIIRSGEPSSSRKICRQIVNDHNRKSLKWFDDIKS